MVDPSVELGQGSDARCSASVVSDDARLVAWLREAVPTMTFRRIDPSTDHGRGDVFTAVRLTVVDDRCLDAGSEDGGLCADLQRWRTLSPLLLLVRRRDPLRVAGLLDAGADDAMCAPFLPEEVRARVTALLRRSRARWDALDAGSLWYDRALREVRHVEGWRRRLTPSEAVVIECLLEAGAETVSRERLLQRLAAEPLQVKSNLVDRHVATLRGKLGDDPRQPRVVVTVAGEGYRLQPITPRP